MHLYGKIITCEILPMKNYTFDDLEDHEIPFIEKYTITVDDNKNGLYLWNDKTKDSEYHFDSYRGTIIQTEPVKSEKYDIIVFRNHPIGGGNHFEAMFYMPDYFKEPQLNYLRINAGEKQNNAVIWPSTNGNFLINKYQNELRYGTCD